MNKLLILGFLFFTSICFAETTYDWQSGNTYIYSKDYSGNTNVRGFSNNGSTWNTTIKPDGDMRGSDKDGNYWSYDDNIGVYNNFGTGETRIRGIDLD